MKNREKLLQVFKSTYNKEYYEKLQQNFEAIFDNLDYEVNYKENLKDLLYKECKYLIQNSISSDIKYLEKNCLEGNNTEIENNRKNIKIYESINLKNVLFSTPNLILYYENSKIYIYKNND